LDGAERRAPTGEIEKTAANLRIWREVFRASGVSAKDVDYIAPAFLPECFFFERAPGS
jgi:serine/threonine-protein kinase HipA